jgi:Na+/glutamate symporter
MSAVTLYGFSIPMFIMAIVAGIIAYNIARKEAQQKTA